MYATCEVVELGSAHEIIMSAKIVNGEDGTPFGVPSEAEFDE